MLATILVSLAVASAVGMLPMLIRGMYLATARRENQAFWWVMCGLVCWVVACGLLIWYLLVN